MDELNRSQNAIEEIELKLAELEKIRDEYFSNKDYYKNNSKRLDNEIKTLLKKARDTHSPQEYVVYRNNLYASKVEKLKALSEQQNELSKTLPSLKKTISSRKAELRKLINAYYDEVCKEEMKSSKETISNLKAQLKENVTKDSAILKDSTLKNSIGTETKLLKKQLEENLALTNKKYNDLIGENNAKLENYYNALIAEAKESGNQEKAKNLLVEKSIEIQKNTNSLKNERQEKIADYKIDYYNKVNKCKEEITEAKSNLKTNRRHTNDKIRESNGKVLELENKRYSYLFRVNGSKLPIQDRISRYFKELRLSWDWVLFYRNNKAWIYLLPAIVLLLIFTVYPIINTIRIAFLENYSPLGAIGGETFSFGFGNFTKVVTYYKFLTCLKNTMLLTVLTVPISCFLALLVSVFLNSITKFSRTLQTIYFLPYVTNAIAIGMVFAMMFNIVGLTPIPDPDAYTGTLEIYSFIINGETKYYVAQSWGIVNYFIMLFGGKPINWINAGSGYWANIFVMVFYIVWNALPFKILILLGGLQSVNKQYYEAAKIDGASRSRVFWKITVPLLSPMIAYVVITGFIGGFKEYSSIVGVFGESMGPAGNSGSLNTIVGYIYNALSEDSYGLASAAALILFLIILAVTLVNLWVSKKKVHY